MPGHQAKKKKNHFFRKKELKQLCAYFISAFSAIMFFSTFALGKCRAATLEDA
jgi:hypothetical protein